MQDNTSYTSSSKSTTDRANYCNMVGTNSVGSLSPIVLIICGAILLNNPSATGGTSIALIVIGSIQLIITAVVLCCSFVLSGCAIATHCLFDRDSDQAVSAIIDLVFKVLCTPVVAIFTLMSPIASVVIGALLPTGNVQQLATAAIVIGSVQIGLGILMCVMICCCAVSLLCCAGVAVGTSVALSDN